MTPRGRGDPLLQTEALEEAVSIYFDFRFLGLGGFGCLSCEKPTSRGKGAGFSKGNGCKLVAVSNDPYIRYHVQVNILVTLSKITVVIR